MSFAALDARDLRAGGRWTRAQALKNMLLRGVVRALFWLADRMPAALLVRLGELAGGVAYRVLPKARAVAQGNVARAELAAEVAQASFVSAGRNLALCALGRRASFRAVDHVELDDQARETLSRALSEGRGVVFVSAHLGPFEWVAAAIAELGYDASVLVRESYDPALDPLVDAHRCARGLDVIHRGKPHAALRAARALRAGRLLGILPDMGGRVPSERVRFVIDETLVPVGPARLAHGARCPIVVGTLERVRARGPSRRFALRLDRVRRAQTPTRTTQRVMAIIEAAIRRDPAEWLWMGRPLGLVRERSRLQKNPGER